MTSFAVDVSQVQQASAMVSASAETIRVEVHAMMAHLNNLQSSWQGGAALQFQEVSAQWQTTQGQVEESLIAINMALDRSAQTYLEAENLVRGAFAM